MPNTVVSVISTLSTWLLSLKLVQLSLWGGKKGKWRIILFWPDGVILLRFTMTKFMFSEVVFAMTWTTSWSLILRKIKFQLLRSKVKFQRQGGDIVPVSWGVVCWFLVGLTESTLTICTTSILCIQRKRFLWILLSHRNAWQKWNKIKCWNGCLSLQKKERSLKYAKG